MLKVSKATAWIVWNLLQQTKGKREEETVIYSKIWNS